MAQEREIQEIQELDYDTLTQSILLASSEHDIPTLRSLLHNCRANVQDPETLFSPLHAAIAACEPASPTPSNINGTSSNGHNDDTTNGTTDTNGIVDGVTSAPHPNLDAAVATLKYLLQNGAIWNDLDANNETPGCLAKRLGLDPLYEIIVDAGVRAELLLNRLDGYETLPEASDSDTEQSSRVPISDHDNNPPSPSLSADKDTSPSDPSLVNDIYLSSSLTQTPTILLDASSNGVMMTWETPLMQRTATLLLHAPGLRVLNIGHGLGIIDAAFQTLNPSAHHIIEAHPAVLSQLNHPSSWSTNPTVTIHAGRWQEVVPKLLDQGETFDAIYFDTFAESYNDLRTFFTEQVVGLLAEKGRFGFFMGCGADRRVCYDVYTKVVEMDLFEAGFEVEWEDVEVDLKDVQEEGERSGVRRRYWVLDSYRLPICRFLD